MKKLGANILVVVITTLIIFGLQKLVEPYQFTSSGEIFVFFASALFFIFPLFVIVLSAFYQSKNPNFKGYFKSLLIPLSFGIVSFAPVFIDIKMKQEEMAGLSLIFFVIFLIIILIISLIINSIILGIKYSKRK